MQESCACVSPGIRKSPRIHRRPAAAAEHKSPRSGTALAPVVRTAVSRQGALNGELLLVLAGVGCVVVCLNALVPPPDHPEQPRRIDLISGYELSLGDEFVCMVSLTMTETPNSVEPPVYMSRLKFVSEAAASSDVYMLDITVEENGHLNQKICRTWNLLSATEALDHLYERGMTNIAPARMTRDDQLAAICRAISHGFQPVTGLQEPLQPQLSGEMQEEGVLVLTSDVPLDRIRDIEGFPLERLAAAIDEISSRWSATPENLMAVLATNTITEANFTVSRQHAVSRLLVGRLLEVLPQPETVSEPVNRH